MCIAGCITLKGARKDVITALVLPEDVPPKPKKAAKEKADAPADAPDVAGAKPSRRRGRARGAATGHVREAIRGAWTTRSTRNQQSPEATHTKAAGLSAAALDDLAAIRTGIVRAALETVRRPRSTSRRTSP